MAVKLVALDIDGTVLDWDEDRSLEPSQQIKAAVAALQSVDIEVVIASGRMMPGTLVVAEALGVTTPLICQQGAAIHEHDGQVRREFPLDLDIALGVIDYARRMDRLFEWFTPHRYVVSAANEAAERYGMHSGVTPEWNANPERLGIHPTGVGVISPKDESSDIHRELTSTFGDAIHLLDFPGVTVGVAPDANKGNAVSILAAEMGIEQHEVVAIGDSVNDAAMLAWAGLGIAVGGADVYAREAADQELEQPGVAGVAAYLESLVDEVRAN